MKKEQFNHLLFLLILGRTAEGTADDNAREHRTMCRLLQAATGKLSDMTVATNIETHIATLRAANMSTSPKEWQALFDPKNNSNAYEKLSAEGKKEADALGGAAAWEAWRTDKEEAEKKKIGTQANKDFPAIADAEQRFALHNRLLELTAEVVKVRKKWQAAKDFITNDETNNIKKLLREEVYGDGATADELKQTTGFGSGSNWAAHCNTDANRKSIAGDFLCMCSGPGGNSKECSGAFTGAEIACQATITTQWADLKASCALHTDNIITAHEITAALEAWNARLTLEGDASDNKVRLGKSSDKTCTGAAGKTCIDYSTFFKKASPTALDSLPWYRKMRQPAVAIEKRALQQAQESLYAATIEATYAKAIAAYQAAVLGKLVPTQSKAQAQAEQKGTGNSQKQQAICTAHKNNKKACTDANCTWKGGESGKGECEIDKNQFQSS
uniref:Variant surface glycoprotein 1275 n=1 Tax=Trypanosoma brucei TaxID=5691 RepID=M4SW09_9TRYP|nr:variant surface glycoprotein 1275 [Trypanosoma brucei]